MAAQVDYAKFVREINQRLAGGQAGTIFLKTSDGHSFSVAFQGGAITGVTSGLTVGNDAIDKLRRVEYASYRISPTPFNPPGSRPDAFHLSLLLGGPVPTPSAMAATPAAGNGSDFHRRALEVIEAGLLEVLGPFATVILDDARKSASGEYASVDDLRELLAILASEIGDREEAEQFVRITISALKENR